MKERSYQTESTVKTQGPADSVLGAEYFQELLQREITAQNERHLVALIVATCVAVTAYIGYDYLTLPLLWSQMVVWRLLDILCGIVVIVLFLRKSISGLTAWGIFAVFNALHLTCFASLYEDRIHLIAANVNLSVAMFILPLALLTYPIGFSICITLVFITSYLFWNILNSPVSFSDILINGGAFNIFAMLVSVLGHWSKVRSTKQLVKLKLIIETKNQEILEQNHKLELQATYDALTGAFNRVAGLKILEDRIGLNQRDGRDLTIVYVDVDNLKTTNDGLGHKFGDQLIVGVVESMRSTIRDVDLVCRVGGDEFLVVMSDCELTEAKRIMGHICAQLEQRSEGSPFPFEISWGALSYNKGEFESLNEFIEAADHLMYEAKQEKKRLFR